MRSNSIENPARPRPAPPACTERSERARLVLSEVEEPALSRAKGTPAEGPALPACTERSERAPSGAEGSIAEGSAVEGHSERTCRAEGARPHPALPKLNANRNTNLLAIALTHWKQRATTLSNRGKIQLEKNASGCAHPTTPVRRERE